MAMKQLVRWSLLLLFVATPAMAQDPATPPEPQQSSPNGGRMQGPGEGRGLAVFGKITAIKDGALELTKPDGNPETVKITDKTEFRKDRQGAKLSDFKVGDMVFIRADDSGGRGLTALMVATRSGSMGGPGMGGPGGPGGNMMMVGGGEMGKDFVIGEVKSIDAPQITIQRPDNVTQKLELTEETSLRKGRESVTMADIQPGDHVFVRGALQNNVFVPKSVQVIPAEQWKRMQDMGMMPGGSKPPGDAKPNPPQP